MGILRHKRNEVVGEVALGVGSFKPTGFRDVGVQGNLPWRGRSS